MHVIHRREKVESFWFVMYSENWVNFLIDCPAAVKTSKAVCLITFRTLQYCTTYWSLPVSSWSKWSKKYEGYIYTVLEHVELCKCINSCATCRLSEVLTQMSNWLPDHIPMHSILSLVPLGLQWMLPLVFPFLAYNALLPHPCKLMMNCNVHTRVVLLLNWHLMNKYSKLISVLSSCP